MTQINEEKKEVTQEVVTENLEEVKTEVAEENVEEVVEEVAEENVEEVEEEKVEEVEEEVFTEEKYSDIRFDWEKIEKEYGQVNEIYKEQCNQNIENFKKFSIDKKIRPDVAKQIFEFNLQTEQEFRRKNDEVFEARKQEVLKELSVKYPQTYEKKIETLKKHLKNEFGDDPLAHELETYCGLNPKLFEYFVAKEAQKSNVNFSRSVKKVETVDLDKVQNRMREIKNDIEFHNSNCLKYESLNKEYKELMNKIIQMKGK